MKFRKMSIAGTAWLHDPDLQAEALKNGNKAKLMHKKRSKGKKPANRHSVVRDSKRLSHSQSIAAGEEHLHGSEAGEEISRHARQHHGGRTHELLEYIQRRPHTVFARKVRFFLLSLAICHTCIPETNQEGEINYLAASPDELALVKAAQEMGYVVADRQAGSIRIKTHPRGSEEVAHEEVYQILDVIEFSSARKRMSIIVRTPEQRVCVFCKGADTTIMQLLRLSTLAADKATAIERRVSQRKSLEAHEALRRNSEAVGRRSSVAKTSLSLSRPSFGRTSLAGPPRRSMQQAVALPPAKQSIDVWLRERERDVDLTSMEDELAYYSPRPSGQISGRSSYVHSERRDSMQTDADDELVEEALVINDAAVFERCFQHINDFATEGLRTLMYSYRYVDDQEYASWKKIYSDATTSLVDRQEKTEKAAELIERQFELAGATAIEDKLQQGVPEAIEKLRRANIKMWMLTGDKRETAINIGHSCRLIKDYSSVTILDHETGEVDRRIAAAIVSINSGTVPHSVIVIDGQTLSIIEAQETVRRLFVELAVLADSIICCRASPSQKAGLVKAIRHKVKNAVTLAIGDGANDIAMIQEAHVGIGITGKEGLQAARTSDYSIAQFRFLLKLLLVHGRWNYIRICKYTLGTFWKELMFYLTQALYQRETGHTGTSLYESWSLTTFNTLFTSLPIIFLGIFEKDLAASTLLAVPELYARGQRNSSFNIKIFLWWAFMAASEAVMIYYIMLCLYGRAMFTTDNLGFAMGDLTFTACVILISLKLQALELHSKSITAAISIFLSVGGWFLWNLILSAIYPDNSEYDVKGGLIHRFGRNPLWWLALIVSLASCVLLEISIKALRTTFFPSDVDTFQSYEQDRAVRKRFEEAAASELQLGWDRGKKKSSLELAAEEAAAAAREAQVQELLDRPRVMDEGGYKDDRGGEGENLRRRHSASEQGRGSSSVAFTSDYGAEGVGGGRRDDVGVVTRKSADITELFSRGFGSVRKGQELK